MVARRTDVTGAVRVAVSSLCQLCINYDKQGFFNR